MSYYWKYLGGTHRDWNIRVELNHKIPIMLHNLENYDAHFIMQEFGIFNFKLNFISNRLEKHMCLAFIISYCLLIAFSFWASHYTN